MIRHFEHRYRYRRAYLHFLSLDVATIVKAQWRGENGGCCEHMTLSADWKTSNETTKPCALMFWYCSFIFDVREVRCVSGDVLILQNTRLCLSYQKTGVHQEKSG